MRLRESRLPLRFCNRYVSTGLRATAVSLPPELAVGVTDRPASAFQLLERVQFASLHVTWVDAQMTLGAG